MEEKEDNLYYKLISKMQAQAQLLLCQSKLTNHWVLQKFKKKVHTLKHFYFTSVILAKHFLTTEIFGMTVIKYPFQINSFQF
jgi:hypothetical protein